MLLLADYSNVSYLLYLKYCKYFSTKNKIVLFLCNNYY